VPFNLYQRIDLSNWTFEPSSSQIQKIVAALPTLNEPQIDDDPKPRTKLQEVAPFLQEKAQIKTIDRIAIGELSDVYRGEYGRRTLAIKAFPNSLLPTATQEALLAEVALASNLNHPAFLRISHVLFDGHVCFVVSDHVSGAATIARRIREQGAAAFSVNEVVDILNQLCEATVEAEVAGLRYLSITPSQIFVREDRTELLLQDPKIDPVPELSSQKITRKIIRLSPINFAQFKTNFRQISALWNDSVGPYMSPEYWRGNKWFKDLMAPVLGRELQGDELHRVKQHKAHQFALGMLAWTMLEGRAPFSSCLCDTELEDIDCLKDAEQQFLQDSESFSQRVAEAPWRTEARALSRIIQRMVHHDPAKRWSSTNQVRLLVQALAAGYAGNNLDRLVKDAYQIVRREGSDDFYRAFYGRLFQKRPHLRSKFPTDMSRQHQMLDYAVGQLLNFSQQQSEPTTLTQFVAAHGKLGLSKDDFEEFGNALIESFDAGLAKERRYSRMMAALEIVIWPGIYYMVQKCTPTAANGARP
jgi:serine/threonine protein kinase